MDRFPHAISTSLGLGIKQQKGGFFLCNFQIDETRGRVCEAWRKGKDLTVLWRKPKKQDARNLCEGQRLVFAAR